MTAYKLKFLFETQKDQKILTYGSTIVQAENIIDAHTEFANNVGKKLYWYTIYSAEKL